MNFKLRGVGAVATLVAIVMVGTGCGTVMNHVLPPGPPEMGPDGGAYGGVRWDLAPLQYGDQTGGGIVILDAPLSLVGDTLMLPYDLSRNRE